MVVRHHHHTAAALIIAALLTACTNPPSTTPNTTGTAGYGVPAAPITGAFMCTRPEVNNPYPNSTEFARSGQDENITASGSCTVMFISNDDQRRIYDHYTVWLESLDYHYFSGISSTTDASARNFQRPDCRQGVTLAVKSPQALSDRNDPPPTQPGTRTVFEITALIHASPACYPPKPIPAPPPTPSPRLP